jgi:hypothetical protein
MSTDRWMSRSPGKERLFRTLAVSIFLIGWDPAFHSRF